MSSTDDDKDLLWLADGVVFIV